MRSVLIVEDNEAMLRGLEDNFELKGYRVKTARDGEQGLNAALAENPDLIILDIMLPKMNGYEICSQVRKKKSRYAYIHAHRQGPGIRRYSRAESGRGRLRD